MSRVPQGSDPDWVLNDMVGQGMVWAEMILEVDSPDSLERVAKVVRSAERNFALSRRSLCEIRRRTA